MSARNFSSIRDLPSQQATSIGRPSQSSYGTSKPVQPTTVKIGFTSTEQSALWEYITEHQYDTEQTLETLRAKLDVKWNTKDIKDWLLRNRVSQHSISIDIEREDDLSLFSEADTQILEIILQSGRDWRNPAFLRNLSEVFENTTDGRLVLPMDIRKYFEKMQNAEKRNGLVSTGVDLQKKETMKNTCKVQLLPRRTGYILFFNAEISKGIQGNHIDGTGIFRNLFCLAEIENMRNHPLSSNFSANRGEICTALVTERWDKLEIDKENLWTGDPFAQSYWRLKAVDGLQPFYDDFQGIKSYILFSY